MEYGYNKHIIIIPNEFDIAKYGCSIRYLRFLLYFGVKLESYHINYLKKKELKQFGKNDILIKYLESY